MAQITQKLATMRKALASLQDAITVRDEYQKTIARTHREMEEKIALGLRDSIIQRFEYCTDLFWKFLKVYLEEVQNVSLSINSPLGIIRACVEAKVMTESQGERCIEMIKNRNLTSHIYREEIAQTMASQIPGYHELMHTIVEERVR